MKEFIELIREKNPLVHNITNQVVANDVANALLAIGASPMMAYAAEEMEDVARIADAVVLNIGTLTRPVLESMILVGEAANRLQTPIVLDPVGVGATAFRREAVSRLLSSIQVQLIRGNAGELATLAGVPWNSKGVDAGEGSVSLKEIARIVAQKYQTIVFISGEEDIIYNGERVVRVQNGHPLMTQITGTGCMLSGICGAFLAVGADPLESAVASSAAYAIAGELAVEQMDEFGPGHFRPALMNSLYQLTDTIVQERMTLKEEDENE